MIEMSKYLPRQFNGPVINSLMQSLDSELSNASYIEDYLYSLSISLSQETELENIGLIIGYPRPLVPEGFEDDDVLLIGDVPMSSDTSTGLAVLDSDIGGRLYSVDKTDSSYMDLGLYRKALSRIAILKRYGITIKSIEKIASLFSPDYQISWDDNGDIILHYTQSIGYKNVWLLTQLFYCVALCPQISIYSD